MKIYAFILTLLTLLYFMRESAACEEYLSVSPRHAEATIIAQVDGVEVGFISYTKEHTRTYIEFMQVDQGYKRNGIGTRLMREMIEESRPETIQAVLAFDNWEAAEVEFVDGSTDEEMCRRMARLTPFYKSASRFGYGKIQECWARWWGHFELVLGR